MNGRAGCVALVLFVFVMSVKTQWDNGIWSRSPYKSLTKRDHRLPLELNQIGAGKAKRLSAVQRGQS